MFTWDHRDHTPPNAFHIQQSSTSCSTISQHTLTYETYTTKEKNATAKSTINRPSFDEAAEELAVKVRPRSVVDKPLLRILLLCAVLEHGVVVPPFDR